MRPDWGLGLALLGLACPLRVEALQRPRLLLGGGGGGGGSCSWASSPASLSAEGDAVLRHALNISRDASNELVQVASADGIEVYARDLVVPANSTCSKIATVVVARGYVECSVEDLVRTLRDASRVTEYNPNCLELRELARYSDDDQVVYSSTPPCGPFKKRDFVTAVHWRRLDAQGSEAVVNHAVETACPAPKTDRVRSRIILGAQLLRAVSAQRTEITLVSSVDLGGVAATTCGARLAAQFAKTAPVSYIRDLETAAQKIPEPADADAPNWQETWFSSTVAPPHFLREPLSHMEHQLAGLVLAPCCDWLLRWKQGRAEPPATLLRRDDQETDAPAWSTVARDWVFDSVEIAATSRSQPAPLRRVYPR